ncbi:PAP2 superfamily protein [Halobiforma haloterrestris]|uniref:PAP2 superfamily protein n=1 Tax=Natronobacterium haloterrestre TaxID=148448 RepID=A0A1I1JSR3_NATHA|nr:phosphatase PAP2 family protein [Halobiforma haloterrestris]SFC51261.1 PAP2 superfamily protein [Halobiforma haloterrestris]
MRLVTESELIRNVYPEAYTDIAAFVTELGGSTGLIVILAVMYWLTWRRESALVAGYAVASIGFILFIKSIVALPRPPESVHLVPLTDDPYGFPSGHAFMATVVYGGLLVVLDRYRDPLPLLGTVLLVTSISLSRVVLGLHYLGDVVAGAGMGVAFLGLLHRFARGNPQRAYATGAVIAVPAIVVSNGSPYALLALGGGIGGTLAVTRVESMPERQSATEALLLSVIGSGYLVVLGTLESTIVTISLFGTVLVNALLVAGVLLLPAAVRSLLQYVSLTAVNVFKFVIHSK